MVIKSIYRKILEMSFLLIFLVCDKILRKGKEHFLLFFFVHSSGKNFDVN